MDRRTPRRGGELALSGLFAPSPDRQIPLLYAFSF